MNRNGMQPRIARFAIPLTAMAILAAACTSRTSTVPQGPGPGVVPIGRTDSGHVISVHVGQLVRVSLGQPGAGSAWSVATYPRSILQVTSSDPKHGTFTFRALSKGKGLLGFTPFGRCGPPLPAAAPAGGLCPVGGKALPGGPEGKPALVIYTIRVT